MFIRDGGEYGFEANSEEEERERKRRTAELYQERMSENRRGRDGSAPFDQRQTSGNRREQLSMDRRAGVGQSRDRNAKDNDRTSFSSIANENSNMEGDFFDNLMSQLSNDLRDDSSQNESRARGTRRHDNAGPNTAKAAVDSNTGAEDSFFENLMAELGGALDKSESFSSRGNKPASQVDDDDFFASLEAELSQSLGGDFQNENAEEGIDDFFASLESEIGNVGDASSISGVDVALRDDSSTSREVDDADDFFSSLIEDLAQEMSSKETESEVIVSTKAISDSRNRNLSSLTVPELKDLLRSKGLKVGGTKAELIDRLQSAV